jgi:hypothetical protein
VLWAVWKQGARMPSRQATKSKADPLTDTRRRSDYTPAEQQFSAHLQKRLQDLLEGRSNTLGLLRRYPSGNGLDRLGIIPIPKTVSRAGLRLEVVEALTWAGIDSVRSDGTGGPVAQSVARDGSTVELQIFPTRYPHVVIERVDRYGTEDGQPLDTTWSLRRVQNQRAQTQVNRVLDVLGVTLAVVGLVR